MKKKYSFMVGITVLFLPVVVFADTAVKTLKDVIDRADQYLGYIIPLLFSLALVVFIIGIVRYIFIQEKKEEARSFILWGLVGLFVMMSVWALVNILSNTFFGTSGVIPQAPTQSGQRVDYNVSGGSNRVNYPVPGGGGTGSNLNPSDPTNLGGYNYGSVPTGGNFDPTMRLGK